MEMKIMDSGGEFAADFLAKNIKNITDVAKKTYEKLDEKIQLKIKSAYTKYLETTAEKYSKSKSFFISERPVYLYDYYVPIGISCASTEITTPSIESCIKESFRIVITGTGGSGKSILVKHLFLDCISNSPYAPILVELRDLNNDNTTLDDFIEETLDTYGFKISGDYVSSAKKEGGFCFFLDGYDEVNHSQRETLLKQIKALSNNFPKCPIVISSRPEDDLNGIDDYSIFSILPLDLESASSLINKLPFDEVIKKKFVHDLEGGLFEKHKSFLSNPLLLSIMLLTYGQNAEIPSKLSIFYDQAYQALFQRHDANKGGYNRQKLTNLDIQDFSRVFSLFSLQTYENRLFKMPKTESLSFIEKSRDNLHKDFNSEDYLDDLLKAVCLLVEDGLDIAFSHRSFQEYFVAIYISKAPPEIQEKLIDRYWKNIRSDNVIKLLLEINPELVERLLFIPKLENLFAEIGVKKSVGITHTAKYFLERFETISLSSNQTRATFFEDKVSLSDVVRYAVLHCDTFVFLSNSTYEEHCKSLCEKYGEGDHDTKGMTYKTPLLADILNSGGGFSISYLDAAFKAYKILKSKHENRASNFDDLLGIK